MMLVSGLAGFSFQVHIENWMEEVDEMAGKKAGGIVRLTEKFRVCICYRRPILGPSSL